MPARCSRPQGAAWWWWSRARPRADTRTPSSAGRTGSTRRSRSSLRATTTLFPWRCSTTSECATAAASSSSSRTTAPSTTTSRSRRRSASRSSPSATARPSPSRPTSCASSSRSAASCTRRRTSFPRSSGWPGWTRRRGSTRTCSGTSSPRRRRGSTNISTTRCSSRRRERAWAYLGTPPSRLDFVTFSTVLSVYLEGCFYPEGGFQSLADALHAGLERHGGELVLGRRVTRILVDEGRATGVELEGGDRVGAKRVISNADATATFEELVVIRSCRAASSSACGG